MYDAPIREVSGACFAGDRLVIVGDAQPLLAWCDWSGEPGTWSTLDVAALPGAPKKTGQFEAVEHLSGDTVVILCEEPALLIAVDLAGEISAWWQLDVELKGLTKPWHKDPNSHGEGLFFGKDRVYVVKEKKPAAIVEFGLPGQVSGGDPAPGGWTPPPAGVLQALAYWELERADVSDACIHDGQVWLLSDLDRSYGPMNGPTTRLDLDKPEGLARTPEGKWLVALDNPDGRKALWVLE